MHNSKFISDQVIGVGCITVFIGICTIGMFLHEKIDPSYAETHVTVSGYDGAGRRGMFALWLILIFIFTIINLLLAIHRHFRQPG